MVNKTSEEENERVSKIKRLVNVKYTQYQPEYEWIEDIIKTLKGARRTIWFVQGLNMATYALGFGLIIFAAIHAALIIKPQEPKPPAQESSAQAGTQTASHGKTTSESSTTSSTPVTEPKQESKTALKTSPGNPAQESPAQGNTSTKEANVTQGAPPATQESTATSSTPGSESKQESKTTTAPPGEHKLKDIIVSGASAFSGILLVFLNFFLVNPTKRIQKVYTDLVQMRMAYRSYAMGIENVEKAFPKGPSNPNGINEALEQLKSLTTEMVTLIEKNAEVEEEKLSIKGIKKEVSESLVKMSEDIKKSQPTEDIKKEVSEGLAKVIGDIEGLQSKKDIKEMPGELAKVIENIKKLQESISKPPGGGPPSK